MASSDVCPMPRQRYPLPAHPTFAHSGEMPNVVVIADDIAGIPRIRMALRRAAALRVEATLDGRRPVAEHLSALSPDLVLVDHMCQRVNSLARLREARECAPGAIRLLLAERRDDASVEDAFEAGAHA